MGRLRRWPSSSTVVSIANSLSPMSSRSLSRSRSAGFCDGGVVMGKLLASRGAIPGPVTALTLQGDRCGRVHQRDILTAPDRAGRGHGGTAMSRHRPRGRMPLVAGEGQPLDEPDRRRIARVHVSLEPVTSPGPSPSPARRCPVGLDGSRFSAGAAYCPLLPALFAARSESRRRAHRAAGRQPHFCRVTGRTMNDASDGRRPARDAAVANRSRLSLRQWQPGGGMGS